ncbi:winged helix-turn-helix transcriptional regulator [Elizabethkingia argentiflava]|uniref:Winged helix-turn-helix transcriptional regulator n=1 Tax=Elizabethkingia argenteiflava TaxID=2681556 RepID=A0A845PVQ4_9FLAO|nr:Lrp/AsnC family transcriptional regulator [Elizabethkingia argenteiflava]NAW50388.1 winged helix-turn-helix transcriptional regulator [Elizabethkingia argenteiflava]
MRKTSIIAHELLDKTSFHSKIIIGLTKIKKGSFREIAQACGLREDQVWKRLSELEKKGLIRYTGEIKICQVSSRPVGVWELL